MVVFLSKWTDTPVKTTLLGRIALIFKGALQAVPLPRISLVNIGLSAITWSVVSMAPYFLFKALGLDLGFWRILYAAFLLQLVGLLPFQVLGGLGILDASWTLFLFSQGMTFQQAAEFALASRTLHYGFVALWGILGWSFLNASQVRARLKVNLPERNISQSTRLISELDVKISDDISGT